MEDWLSRTEMLLGAEGLVKLKSARVLVVGLGGVGAYAAEMICRAGTGSMTIVDGDKINSSN
ncbi:MAG: ThiF family adenylyltransferase, partial [Bacteroidales bacterium]